MQSQTLLYTLLFHQVVEGYRAMPIVCVNTQWWMLEIFDEFGHIFPSQLVELQISQLVPKIEELINLIITTNQTVTGILNRSQTETI